MSDYLSADELADLVGCKRNQREGMCAWLDRNHWRYATDRIGLPKVAKAYRDRKLGVSSETKQNKYHDAPNLQAFN